MTARRRRLVFLHNEFGRRGVAAARSFEQWVGIALSVRPQVRRSVNIALVGLREGRRMNRQFRDRDYATNVLSFPYEPARGEKSAPLGDLVLCPPVIAREAAEQGKPLRHHYAHLTIHGVLHLLGYDHETDAQAERMERLERKLLSRLGIPDPY